MQTMMEQLVLPMQLNGLAAQRILQFLPSAMAWLKRIMV